MSAAQGSLASLTCTRMPHSETLPALTKNWTEIPRLQSCRVCLLYLLMQCFSYVRPSKKFLNNIKSATNCDLRNCTSCDIDRKGHFSPLQRLRSLTSHSLVHSAGCRSQGHKRHSPGPTHEADTRTAQSRDYSCSVAAQSRRDCRRRLRGKTEKATDANHQGEQSTGL